MTGLLVFVALVLALVFFIAFAFAGEIKATQDRDPAAQNMWEVLLLYPGLHAVIAYRISQQRARAAARSRSAFNPGKNYRRQIKRLVGARDLRRFEKEERRGRA